MLNKRKIQKFLSKSVTTLLTSNYTCCHLILDDRLALYVGWSSGYGEEIRDDCIQDKESPDWAIVAGIKVHTSSYMQTDFDDLNYPYEKDGEIWDSGISLTPTDFEGDYEIVADWFIEQYKELEKLIISEEGEIIRN